MQTPALEDARLLNLPLDILFEIMDYLPLHTRVILSQTSSDLRAVTKEDITKTLLTGPKAERVNYLRLREKAFPEYRLCYMCMKLHKLEV